MGKNDKEKSKQYKNQRICKENRDSQAPIVERNCGDHFVYVQKIKELHLTIFKDETPLLEFL